MRSPFIFYSVIFLLWVYTAFKATQLFGWNRILVWVVTLAYFVLMMGWQFWYRSDAHAVDSSAFRALAWAGSIALGVWGTFIILTLPFDLLHLISSGVQTATKSTAFNEDRRQWLLGLLPWTLAGTSATIAGMGLVQTLFGPKVKETKVTFAGIPKSLEGLRIVQISDLHIGATIQKGYVEDVVRSVNELNPDIIAVTGDLADGTPKALGEHLAPLANLKSRLGTFYVTGNHEYYWGIDDWVKKVRELGMLPLLNENRTLDFGGEKILVAGVTDHVGRGHTDDHHPNMGKAGAAKEVSLKILLAHRPDVYEESEKHGFHLQLSGHTHAGQFFPWNLIVRLVHQFYMGLNRHQNLWVYVNGGTGYWGPPHRFMIPSEISLLVVTA